MTPITKTTNATLSDDFAMFFSNEEDYLNVSD